MNRNERQAIRRINGNAPTQDWNPPFLQRSVKMKTALIWLMILVVALMASLASTLYLAISRRDLNSKITKMQVVVITKDALIEEQSRKITKTEQEMQRRLATVIDEECRDYFSRRFDEALTGYLEKNGIGCMEIKDFQSLGVTHRQAAIKGKGGFLGLPKDTLCTMHCYVVKDQMGIGIASTIIEEKRYFFTVKWHGGSVAAPENVYQFKIPQGKKIEITRSS